MPSNATVATRWTMLPLLAGESSGKSQQRQEQSKNKAANRPVIESCFGPRRRTAPIGRDCMSRAWVNSRAGIGLLALTWAAGGLDPWFVGTSSAQQASAAQPIWTVPEIGALPSNTYGRLVRRGRDLITATYAYIGPEVADRAKRFAGNNLACGNCHPSSGDQKVVRLAVSAIWSSPRS